MKTFKDVLHSYVGTSGYRHVPPVGLAVFMPQHDTPNAELIEVGEDYVCFDERDDCNKKYYLYLPMSHLIIQNEN